MTRSSNVVVSSSPAVRLACLVLVGSLAGCSTFDKLFSSDKVDYKTGARQTGGLEVPPDLTQLARSNAGAQGGSISASSFAQAGNAAPKTAAAPANAVPVAVNAAGGARLERAGSERWVHTGLTPEQVWPQLKSFWADRGFEIVKEQADVGIIETGWAENRAKLPQDIIRSTIGKIFDGLYSTGERDMYRTRIERNAQGGTDIFISHRGMVEVYTNQQRDNTAWQPRPADPQLEAEMLSRLVLKFGGKEEPAKTAVAEAKAQTNNAAVNSAAVPSSTLPTDKRLRPLSEVPDSLTVNEGFDRAWRRVGQSLDRHGFTIEDRDRPQGLFYLRYADPNRAGDEEPNFFQKLFGLKSTVEPVRYRVSVKSEGDKSTVMVLDNKGQQKTDELAKRILNLLMDDLR